MNLFQIEEKKEYYLFLDLEGLDIKTDISEVLYGMPTPVTYLSFATALLLKSEVINKEDIPKIFIGIKEFSYTSQKQKGIEGKKIKILKQNRANISFSLGIYFKSEADNEEIIAQINKTIDKLRFSSGFINRKKIELLDSEDKLKFKMLGSFELKESEETIESLNNIIDSTLRYGSNKEVTILGYSIISEQFKEEGNHEYNSAYVEPLYGLVFLRAFKKSNLKDIKYWQFITNENKILTTQKGE